MLLTQIHRFEMPELIIALALQTGKIVSLVWDEAYLIFLIEGPSSGVLVSVNVWLSSFIPKECV